MTAFVFLDRDGTVNYDENYWLGSTSDWKSKTKFMPGVISGIKLLNNLSDLEIFIITNQYGVALTGKKFDELTEERMNEVNEYIVHKLKLKGAFVRNYVACPYINQEHKLRQEKRGYKINPEFLRETDDIKPGIGMLIKAAKSVNRKLEESRVYVLGDRYSDVITGLNANGIGILIESEKTKELNDLEKLKSLIEYPDRAKISENFHDACKIIYSKEISYSK